MASSGYTDRTVSRNEICTLQAVITVMTLSTRNDSEYAGKNVLNVS